MPLITLPKKFRQAISDENEFQRGFAVVFLFSYMGYWQMVSKIKGPVCNF